LKAYDPAYAYEIAVIIQDGLKKMYQENEDVFYYITLENENYIQPKMPDNIETGIIKGMYQIKETKKEELKVQLLGSGPILNEVIAASTLLESDWNINSDIWSVTSYSELHKDAEEANRWNLLNPDKNDRTSFLDECLYNKNGPVIACSDYVKLVAEQISPYVNCDFTSIGTDGFGRSGTRGELRNFFEIDRFHIALAAMNALYKQGKIKQEKVSELISRYKIDPDRLNPLKR